MKLDRPAGVPLLVALALLVPSHLPAQVPPASTYQPGPWQPVARVELNRPVRIKIVNDTEIDLDYDLSANIESSPRRLPPGGSTTLQGFTIPAYILINRSESASGRSAANLLFTVEVGADNVAVVTVTTAPLDTPGYTTFNLNKSGAIYVY
jgi:hypothetical protein